MNKNRRMVKDESKRYSRKDEDNDEEVDVNEDDDDDIPTASIFDDFIDAFGGSSDEDAGTSLSKLETFWMCRKPKTTSKRKKLSERDEMNPKIKNPIANPQVKMKRSKFEFEYEAMDVSGEEKSEIWTNEKCKKCNQKSHNIPKKEIEIITTKMKKKKKGNGTKPGKKSKGKTGPRKRATKKKKIKSDRDHLNNPFKREKPGNKPEKKLSKQGILKETKVTDDAKSYGNGNSDKTATAVGDSRSTNNEKKTVADEKKEVADVKKPEATANKGPGPADITAKESKDKTKNVTNKDSKPRNKVEDLSKKVDKKETGCMDEGIIFNVPESRGPRLRRSKRPTSKMMAMMPQTTKPSRKVSPFIKFYMTVYRELCESHKIVAIAKEAARRWKGMSTEEKKEFYTS